MRTRSACSRSSPAVISAADDVSPAARSRSTPAIARSADRSPSGGRLARLTTSPASGIRSSLQPLHEVRRLAQRVGLRAPRPRGTPSRRPGAARRSAGPAAGTRRTACRTRSRTSACRAAPAPPRILVSALVTSPNPAVISRAGPLRRRQQQPHEPAVEEAGEPLGRVEEVQRGARGRGVDDDQVPAAGACGRPGRAGRASPSPCTPGCPRTSWRRRRRTGWPGSAAPSPGWPGSRPPRRRCASCPASSRRGCRPSVRPGRDARHRARGVVERLDPHRLGQPAGRVDGEHDDLAAALGGPQREGGRGGGLADAAGAAADDDPLRRGRRAARRRRAPGSVAGAGGQRPDPARWVRCGARGSASCQPLLAQLGGELVEPGEVDRRRPARAARTSGRRSRRPASRCSSSSARRSAWSRPSSSRASTSVAPSSIPADPEARRRRPARSTVPSSERACAPRCRGPAAGPG